MTTPAREFQANVPYHLIARCVHRLDMLKHSDVRQTLLRQLVTAARYQVRVYAIAIRRNHIHLVADQPKDGQPAPPCTKLREDQKWGLSLWMQAVLAPTAKAGNKVFGFKGAFWEKKFESVPLETVERMTQAIAYLQGQEAHHGPARFQDDLPISSLPTVDVCEDGVTTTLFVLPEFDGLSDEQATQQLSLLVEQIIDHAIESERMRKAEIRAFVERLDNDLERGAIETLSPKQLQEEALHSLEAELYERLKYPWATATRLVLAEHGLTEIGQRDVTSVHYPSVASRRDQGHHERLRAHWSSYRFPAGNHRHLTLQAPSVEAFTGFTPSPGTVRSLPTKPG